MPETGRPFFPPGPWFSNPEGLPPQPQSVVNVGFIASVTQFFDPTLFPQEIFPGFIASVTTLYTPTLTGPQAYTTSGSWTAPPGVVSAFIQCFGGGGGGAGQALFESGGAGGGGAFAGDPSVPVTPGNTYSFTVGGGGAINGGIGGDTTFTGDSGHAVIAKGGRPGLQDPSYAGGAGGTAAASTGVTKFSGGTGATGGSPGGNDAQSGGGGGAGTTQAGGNGGTGSAGIGGSLYGGNGGNHAHPAGNPYGGGGCGAGGVSDGGPAGAGAGGAVIISWGQVLPPSIPSVTVFFTPIVAAGSFGVPFIPSVTTFFTPFLNPKDRLSQLAAEVVATSDPTLAAPRLSQLAVEAEVKKANVGVNLSQLAVEALVQKAPLPNALSQEAVEVLCVGVFPVSGSRFWATLV